MFERCLLYSFPIYSISICLREHSSSELVIAAVCSIAGHRPKPLQSRFLFLSVASFLDVWNGYLG